MKVNFRSKDDKANIAGWFFKTDSSNKTIILVSISLNTGKNIRIVS